MVDSVLQAEVKTENTIITNARHYHALKEVERSLTDIRNGLDNKLPGDLLALDIRRCLHYLGEITGEVSNEDMLDYIFKVSFVLGSSRTSENVSFMASNLFYTLLDFIIGIYSIINL